MGTARWCPPEKHGWQFHRGVEEIAPTVVLRGMKGRGRAWRPIRRMEFTKTKTGGNGWKPHTRPFPFQFSCCRPGKFNRVLIFVWDAVSKWFPADRRRDALLSTTPSPSPLLLLDKDPSQRWAASVVSKRYVSSNDSEGKVSMLISARFSCWSPNDSASSLYWAVARGFDV